MVGEEDSQEGDFQEEGHPEAEEEDFQAGNHHNHHHQGEPLITS